VKPFDLLIFDWDGTLADSPAGIVAGMQAAISDLDLPPRSDSQIGELIGLGMLDGLGRLYPELEPRQLLQKLASYRQQRHPGTALNAPLFAGAQQALQVLHGAGYRLAVATGKHREGLQRSFEEHAAVAPLFELSRCADEAADKPHPLMLEQILDVSGVAAARALMIGDTEYDVAMACAAGVPVVGVACGVHAPQRLQRAGARTVLDDVAALPRWLAAL